MKYTFVERLFMFIMLIGGTSCMLACNESRSPSTTGLADTVRVQELNAMARTKLYAAPDSMLLLSEDALRLSDSLAYESGRFQSLFNKGLAYRALGKNEQSVDQLVSALKVAERLKDSLLLSRVLSVAAQVYVDLGDHEHALKYGMEGLWIAQQAKLRSQEAYLLSIVGMTYGHREKDLDKALEHYSKSLSLYQDLNDSTMMPFLLDNMAHIYLYKGEIGLAEENYKEAYRLAQTGAQPKAVVTALQSLSHFYTRTKQPDLALEYLLKAKDRLSGMPGDRTQYLYMLYQLTDLYQSKGSADLALVYGKEAMEIAEKENRLWHLVRIADKMAEVYNQQNDYRRAYLLNDKARVYQDSLYKKEKEDNIVREEERYKYQREQDRAETEHQLALQRKQSYLYLFIVISISLLMLLLVVGWFLRQRNMWNRMLQKANERIEKQNDKLKDEAQFKTHLISLITHDMRAPIGNLHMIMNILEHETAPGKGMEKSLRECRFEVEKVRYFMDDFLQWAVLQSEGVKIHKSYFNLVEVMQSTALLYEQQAKEKDISVTVISEKDVEVYGVKEAMATVVRNLLGNAIKFTPTAGTIVVKVAEQYNGQEPSVTVSVADNGVGMSEEKLRSLFEQSVQKENGERRGLGLFLCDYFLSLHGSKLQVSSRKDQGTVFSFTLAQPTKEWIAEGETYLSVEK